MDGPGIAGYVAHIPISGLPAGGVSWYGTAGSSRTTRPTAINIGPWSAARSFGVASDGAITGDQAADLPVMALPDYMPPPPPLKQ